MKTCPVVTAEVEGGCCLGVFGRSERTTMPVNLLPLVQLWAVTSGASVEDLIQKRTADIAHKVCF